MADSGAPKVAALLARAIAAHRAGQLAEAEPLYRAILAQQPRHADANHNLGLLLVAVGQPEAGLPHLKAAVEAAPANVTFWQSQLQGLIAANRLDLAQQTIRLGQRRGIAPKFIREAEARLRHAGTPATAPAPGGPEGVDEGTILAHFRAGEHAAVVESARPFTQRHPTHPLAWKVLSASLQLLGRSAEAAGAARQAVALLPDDAEAANNLGLILHALNDRSGAEAQFRRATGLNPDYPDAFNNLGGLVLELGRPEEAEPILRAALRLQPDRVEVLNNLGSTLQRLGRPEDAEAPLRRAIAQHPAFPKAHNNLGSTLADLGRWQEAVASYRRAIEIDPRFFEAWNNLGRTLQYLDPTAAEQCYRRAFALQPDNPTVRSNILLSVHYTSRSSAREIFAEHLQLGEPAVPPPRSFHPPPAPHRPLRIGYVSPDLQQHPVATFLEPLLRAHDPQAVEVTCYAEVPRPDAVTARLRELCSRWVQTVGLSDEELAARSVDDGIDILVDLAGHTARSRLPVFARKPAPIQVAWLGYPDTTGLRAVDYRIVDAITDPAGSDALATEKLIRLPHGFLCFGPLPDAPMPSSPPVTSHGVITFGSFNNTTKLSAATLDAWSAILRRVPNSRLLLKGKLFSDPASSSAFLGRLERDHGFDPSRVRLAPMQPAAADHLAHYAEVDVALDPFPYNGTTTTCEALWMGVPVITLRGDRHSARVGASLLTRVGLEEAIADSTPAYVDLAAAWATDVPRLAELRRTLRVRMAGSPLCDAAGFARTIEAAYEAMWRDYCVAAGSKL